MSVGCKIIIICFKSKGIVFALPKLCIMKHRFFDCYLKDTTEMFFVKISYRYTKENSSYNFLVRWSVGKAKKFI